MTTEVREVAGRTVHGEEAERAGRASRYVQKPIEEFFPLLDAVLDTPGVHSVRWRQDIPSFNDGDPCVFSTNGFTIRLLVREETTPTRVRLTADADDAWEEREDELRSDQGKDYIDPDYTDGYRDSYDDVVRAHAVKDAFQIFDQQEAHFSDALQQAFGDYAEVTAYRDSETGEYAFHVGAHEASY